jgi:hypothetical protein
MTEQSASGIPFCSFSQISIFPPVVALRDALVTVPGRIA